MQGVSGAAQAVVTKSVQDPTTLAAAHELTKVVMSKSAAMRLGALVSGRRLLDVSVSCLCPACVSTSSINLSMPVRTEGP